MEPRQTYENSDAQAFKILHTKIEDEKAKKKRKNVRNTSGQRWISFHAACRNKSFAAPFNNRVIS